MRRVVITNGSGQFISEADVEEHVLVPTIATWFQLLPDAGIYLDGNLVTEDVRLAMQAAVAAATPAHAEPSPDPAQLKEYAETLKDVYADIRGGYVQSLREFHDVARRFSDMWIERERQFADEAARQRALTGRSLADVDLLGRSVKAAELQQVFAAAGSNSMARARQGHSASLMDLLGGLLRAVASQK